MASELERLIIDYKRMQECHRGLQGTIQSLEGQLHIAQECLYYREARTGSKFYTFYLLMVDEFHLSPSYNWKCK